MHRLNSLVRAVLIMTTCVLCLRANAAPESPELSKRADKLPPIKSVAVDPHGRLLVNDEPFFPILMYVETTNEETMKSLVSAGFNVVTTHGNHTGDLLGSGFYAAVHGGGKAPQFDAIVLGIGVDSPALSYPDKTIENTHAANDAVRRAVPGRPIMNAIGYWEDEPKGIVDGKLPRKEKYEDIVAAIEVPSPYLYPVPYQRIDTVADALARARAVSGGKQLLLPILQTFAWEAKDRYPSPDELRCMVYLSLIEGANGIGYYAYHTVTGKKNTDITKEQPDLWKAVTGVNAEARAIGVFALNANEAKLDTEGGPSTGDHRVRVRTITKGKQTLFVVANPTDKPAKVTLKSATKIVSIAAFTGEAPPTKLAGDGKTAELELGATKTAAMLAATE